MEISISRGELLGRSARVGALILGAGATAGSLAEEAQATVPAADVTYVRFLAGAELLASDFYTQAIGNGVADSALTASFFRAYTNEQDHYNSLTLMLGGAGVSAPKASSFTFSYPHGTGPYPGASGIFASAATVVRFAAQLESVMLGAYLGALDVLQTPSWCGAIADVMACEAQHLTFFSMQGKQTPFNLSFPPPLSFADAVEALSPYSSPPLAVVPPQSI